MQGLGSLGSTFGDVVDLEEYWDANLGPVQVLVFVFLSFSETISLNSLAGKVHETIKKVDDEYVKKLGAGGDYLNILRSRSKVETFLSVVGVDSRSMKQILDEETQSGLDYSDN
ncbi:hypothetical protein PTKIN_Ptkin04bG0033900 [Pterospermum kingtungense]